MWKDSHNLGAISSGYFLREGKAFYRGWPLVGCLLQYMAPYSGRYGQYSMDLAYEMETGRGGFGENWREETGILSYILYISILYRGTSTSAYACVTLGARPCHKIPSELSLYCVVSLYYPRTSSDASASAYYTTMTECFYYGMYPKMKE